MSKEEFNLSEKIKQNPNYEEVYFFEVDDVREFIRRLKEELCQEKIANKNKKSERDWVSQDNIFETINQLAGDKLI